MSETEHGKDEILMIVGASAARRWIGVIAIAGLGALFLILALSGGIAVPWRFIFGLSGAAALWGAVLMERATRGRLELTETELRDSDGTLIARIDEIERVDRSAFAMKPSNGFLLVLNRPRDRVWRPGLWWRLGRRVAVGGVTPGSQTRPMADAIALLLSGQR